MVHYKGLEDYYILCLNFVGVAVCSVVALALNGLENNLYILFIQDKTDRLSGASHFHWIEQWEVMPIYGK